MSLSTMLLGLAVLLAVAPFVMRPMKGTHRPRRHLATAVRRRGPRAARALVWPPPPSALAVPAQRAASRTGDFDTGLLPIVQRRAA